MIIDRQNQLITVDAGSAMRVNALLQRYSRAISDPALVKWVMDTTTPTVVEIDAGMAYWSSMLGQGGKHALPYDVSPHPSAYVPVRQLDARRSVLRDSALAKATLLAVAPDDPRTVARALGAFTGPRAVVIMRDVDDVDGILRRGKRKKATDARAALAAALADGGWQRNTTYQGMCVEGHLYTATEYRREEPGDWNQDTQMISIAGLVRPATPMVAYAA